MTSRKILLTVAAIVGAAVVLYIFLNYNPEQTRFPRCPFYVLTSLKCPGCGSQRAIYSILHGDIAAAFQHNALLVACIPIIVLLLVAEMLKRRMTRLYNALCHPFISYTILAAVILWWIFRNITGV